MFLICCTWCKIKNIYINTPLGTIGIFGVTVPMMGTVMVEDMSLESLQSSCPTICQNLSLLSQLVNHATMQMKNATGAKFWEINFKIRISGFDALSPFPCVWNFRPVVSRAANRNIFPKSLLALVEALNTGMPDTTNGVGDKLHYTVVSDHNTWLQARRCHHGHHLVTVTVTYGTSCLLVCNL